MAFRYVKESEKFYTPTLDALVSALCCDFESRAQLIRAGEISRRTAMEYAYLNRHIRDAVFEITPDARGELFIREIGKRTGYAKSEILGISEETYKLQKRDIKLGIARKLHLLD